MPSEFAALARTFFDETLQDSPVLASQLGIDGFDDQLDDLSEAAFDDRRRRAAAWLDRFEQLSDAACASFDELLDRDLLRSHLRGRAILDDWQMWRRQPETYLNPALGGVFILFLHRLKSEPELMRGAQRGVIHKNAASRKVARLAQHVHGDRAQLVAQHVPFARAPAFA